MDIGIILTTNFSDKRWHLNATSYDGLTWLDQSEKPTYQDLEKLWESSRIHNHNKTMEDLRKKDYVNEADPMFFSYQRGEIEKQDWLNKVQEIKDRYPYITIS